MWNRNYVDHVEITGAEMVGLEGRAGFYEETGALRDMVANHLLQLLALTAMEPPVAFDADSVRQQKVQVLKSIRPMTVEEVAKRTLRGQYGPGQVDGKPVPGYRQEPGVKPDSTTETFVALKLFIDNWRWAGVPFHIRTGKRLSHPVTEIRVHLKRTPQALFATTPEDQLERNVITLRIQPNEGISIAFGAKRPGNQMRTVTVQADFSYRAIFGSNTPVAYETLLLDSMLGDPTLFTSRDEVEAEWRIITPIEEAWTQLPAAEFSELCRRQRRATDSYYAFLTSSTSMEMSISSPDDHAAGFEHWAVGEPKFLAADLGSGGGSTPVETPGVFDLGCHTVYFQNHRTGDTVDGQIARHAGTRRCRPVRFSVDWNVMVENLAASRKLGLSRSLSRSGSRVLIELTSISAVTLEAVGLASLKVIVPQPS